MYNTSQLILARMISGFHNSESYPDMFFKKRNTRRDQSLESASERVLARNAQLEVALSRWLLSKGGPPLDLSISKHMARNHSPAKKAEINHLNSPKLIGSFPPSKSQCLQISVLRFPRNFLLIYIL